jgi:ribosomal-protein-alanine N-acetyltransferase
MYNNWANDSDVTRYLTWPAHGNPDISRAVIGDWISRYGDQDFYQWMITFKEEETNPIGSISVVSMDSSVNSMEIGYCIGKAWWHQGIMTEALLRVMDYLFDEVGMNRIEARHDPNNPHSGNVMKKCGMKYEGTLRQADKNNQGVCDSCIYALLAQERQPS